MQSVYHAFSLLMALLGLILATQAKACPELISGDREPNSLIHPLQPDAFSLIQDLKAYEVSKGITEDNQTEFYLHQIPGVEE